MKKMTIEFNTFFEPKEVWFPLPSIVISREYRGFSCGFVFLCFGVIVEFRKHE